MCLVCYLWSKQDLLFLFYKLEEKTQLKIPIVHFSFFYKQASKYKVVFELVACFNVVILNYYNWLYSIFSLNVTKHIFYLCHFLFLYVQFMHSNEDVIDHV